MPRLALVLSGGGARGAYEAGVLSYIFDEVARRLERPVHFDIVSGTSVGAIHACWVAAAQDEPGSSTKLLDVWRSLALDHVFDVGAGDLLRVPLQLLGRGVPRAILPASNGVPERLPGLFQTEWLEKIVLEHIPWRSLRENIDSGRLDALALAATEIATGRSAVFVDSVKRDLPPWARDPYVVARPTRITPGHALASAAIPLVFPALRIGRTFYCDGGLRLNTPLSPALRLGADRVLVIGLRYPRPAEEEDRLANKREMNYSSPAYLVGKALNALLLDRIEYDVDRMHLFNEILLAGERIYGPDFLDKINGAVVAHRNAPFRIVRDFMLRPSQDLGALAADCLQHQKRSRGLRDWLSHQVVRYAGHGTMGEADLLSYLFFDRCYAEHLIELGRADARAAEEQLAAFLS